MTNRVYKIGRSGEQISLLPPCLEDYVGPDNAVRAIDSYVNSLDLRRLGFCDPGADGGAGRPPYAPGDLLKLYLYGYLNIFTATSIRCAPRAGWRARRGAMSK